MTDGVPDVAAPPQRAGLDEHDIRYAALPQIRAKVWNEKRQLLRDRNQAAVECLQYLLMIRGPGMCYWRPVTFNMGLECATAAAPGPSYQVTFIKPMANGRRCSFTNEACCRN